MAVIANLVVKVSANLSDLSKQFTAAESSINQFGGRLKSAGAALTAGVTLPMAALATAAVRSGLEFEGAMNKIQGVMRPTTAQMELLRAKALEMGKDTIFSATDAANAMLELGKAGFSTEQSLAGIGDVLQLAAASGLSMGEAAEFSARTLSAFGLEVSDLAHVNDVLAAAVNASTLEIADLQTAFGYVGPIAKDFGLSIEQTAASLALMRDAGIAADTAGRTLRDALADMVNPVGQTKDAMAELGIASFTDSNGQLMEFGAILDLLKQKGVDGAMALQLFGKQSGPGMAVLIEQGSAALNGLTTRLENSGGAAKAMADSMMQGLPGAFEALKGSINTAFISISKALEPALIPLLGLLERLADFVSGTLVPAFTLLPQPVQSFVIALGAIATAAGPVLFALGTITQGSVALTGLLGGAGLAGGATAAAGGMAALGAALSTVTVALGGFYVSFRAASDLDQFQIGGLRPSEWVEFLAAWKFGLGGVSAENVRLAITSRRVAEATSEIAAMVRAAELANPIKARELKVPGIPEDANPFGDAFAMAGLITSNRAGGGGAAAQISATEQAIRSLVDRLSGGEVVESANNWVEAIRRIGGISNLTTDELASFTQEIEQAVEKLQAMGQEVPRTWQIIANASKNAEALANTRTALGQFLKPNLQIINGEQLRNVGGEFTAGLIGGPAGLGGSQNVTAEAMVYGQTVGRQFSTGMNLSLQELPQTILGALQGGGSVVASVSSLLGGTFASQFSQTVGQKLSGLLGNTLGQSIGSIMGPLGAALGPLIGNLIGGLGKKIWGGIQSIFGTDEEAKLVNPARDAFFAQFGGGGTGAGSGFAELAARLTEITGEEGGGSLFQQLIGADSMEAFEAARGQITQLLAETEAGAMTATSATDGLNLSLQGSDEALNALGATQERVVATMLAGFDSLIAKLSEFIAAMGAANAMALPSVPGVPDGAAPAVEATAPLDVPSFANEGVVSRPTLAMIGDAPEPEFVLRRSTVEGLARAGVSGSGGARIVVNLNGTFMGPADYIRNVVTEGVLDAIRSGGKNFSEFQGLVGSASQA